MKFDILELKDYAARRLEEQRESANRMLLVYLGVLLAAQFVNLVAGDLLLRAADRMTGLSDSGLRSVLMTFQSILNVVIAVAAPLWQAGYMASVLDLSRGRLGQKGRLTYGFKWWGRYLSSGILLAVRMILFAYLGLILGALVVSFVMTRSAALQISAIMTLNPDHLEEAIRVMLPYIILMLVIALGLAGFVAYRYRLMKFVIAQKPELRGHEILRASSGLIYGAKLQFLRLDLSFWWYYVLLVLVEALPYTDILMELLGKPLPMEAELFALVLSAAYLAAFGVLMYLTSNRVQTTYAAAFDQLLREKDLPDSAWTRFDRTALNSGEDDRS